MNKALTPEKKDILVRVLGGGQGQDTGSCGCGSIAIFFFQEKGDNTII